MTYKDPASRRAYMAKNKQRFKERRAALLVARSAAGETCLYEGCSAPPDRRGLCKTHYTRWWRYGDPGVVRVGRHEPGQRCSVVTCTELAIARGWCSRHHRMWRRNGVPELRPVRTPQWNVDGAGYVTKLVEVDGVRHRLSQHRVVMEEVLGRSLEHHETVHHVNGVKTDNRPANLELWNSSHPGGQRVADLIDWANRLISTYGDNPRPYRHPDEDDV